MNNNLPIIPAERKAELAAVGRLGPALAALVDDDELLASDVEVVEAGFDDKEEAMEQQLAHALPRDLRGEHRWKLAAAEIAHGRRLLSRPWHALHCFRGHVCWGDARRF